MIGYERMKKAKNKVLIFLVVCVLFAVAAAAVKMQSDRGSEPAFNTSLSEVSRSESTTAIDEKSTAVPTEQTEITTEKVTEKQTETTTEKTPVTTEKASTTAGETTEKPSKTKKPVTTTLPTTVKETTKKAASYSSSGRIIVNPESGKWNLIVVNSTREIPEGYKPKLKEILGCGKYLDYRVAPHYEKMYYAAKKDGITLTPYSAYRSYERQERNYNNLTNKYMSQYGLSRKEAAKKAATVILPPGTSEHNLGLAMDVCNVYDSFANSKEYAWLQKHAHEYGFILRYTKEKQPITGIVPEPWHWRYVGVEYAKKIKDSGLCLEEYLDSIGVKY